MAESERSCVIPLAEAQKRIPGAPGAHFATFMQRGTVRVLLSLPVSPNRQTPHAQDEVYVIVRGRGVLFHSGRRDPFEAGDFIFVAGDGALVRGFHGGPRGMGRLLWSSGRRGPDVERDARGQARVGPDQMSPSSITFDRTAGSHSAYRGRST